MKTKMPVTTAPVSTIACAPGAIAGGPTRTRFFDGMFLTQADLENEQRYWRIKRRLTNRALGQGVVWGLRLTWNAERHTFTLSPGYAIDCCGNDLVVECPLEISESQLWQLADPSLLAGSSGRFTTIQKIDEIGIKYGDTRSACVVLQYVECPEDAKSVYRDACSTSTSACEASRVRETTRLLLVPPPSPPPLSPPEQLYKELIAFRDGLPSDVRTALFPDDTSGTGTTTTPSTGAIPLDLTITVPGTPSDKSVDLQPQIGSPVTGGPLTAHQMPSNGNSGVVTFELTPSSGWGFTAGTVEDSGRVVEQVTPPVAMSMYWSLDVAIPSGAASQTIPFEFVADLTLEQMFGSHQQGTAYFFINGSVTVAGAAAGSPVGGVDVTVSDLRITVDQATIAQGDGPTACFDQVVPWGWAISTADGATITKVLVLSALYATLEETVARGASRTWQLIAYYLYFFAWRLLFGVDLSADVDQSYIQQLVGFLLELYERWCAGFVYPGPRCADEHHGVYLGCGELRSNGSFASFDLWTNRRYVLTGPLFTHWAGLFGIAPADVIVGRFADAICCLSGQPAITSFPGAGKGVGKASENAIGPQLFLNKQPAMGLSLGNRIVVGGGDNLAKAAKASGASLRWVGSDELATRFMQLFARADTSGPTEMIATSIAGGGSVGVLVPVANAAPASQVRSDVATALRSGPAKVSARVRAPLTELAVNVVGAAPMTTLVATDAPPAVATLAKQLDAKKITVGALLDAGADATLARAGIATPDAATRDAADQLVDRAETALDGVTAGLARAAAPGLGTGVTDTAFVQRATSEVGKAFGGRLAPDAIAVAAKRVG